MYYVLRIYQIHILRCNRWPRPQTNNNEAHELEVCGSTRTRGYGSVSGIRGYRSFVMFFGMLVSVLW